MATLPVAGPGLAQDVYQETLHRLAMRWSRVANPKAFCRRVMHNIVIDQARARQRRPRELCTAHENSDPRSGDPATAVELRPALLAALGTLTPQQRPIVVLRRLDTAAGVDDQGFENPATGAVLETAFSYPRALPESLGMDLYMSVTGSSTLRPKSL